MTQDRNFFGMTTQQVAILAGLGIVVCLLCSVSGVLALRGGLSRFLSRSSESTVTIQLTSTATPTPAMMLTETPTPIPYDQLIPAGWTQYKTTLIELWLPGGFKSAASSSVATIGGNTVFLELAVVSSEKSATYKTNVSVAYEPLLAASVEEFIDRKVSSLPPEVNMAERRKVSINSADVYRLMFERQGQNNLTTNDLLFVFQDGGTIWYVQYSADIVEFYERLADFEKSARTFRIVR